MVFLKNCRIVRKVNIYVYAISHCMTLKKALLFEMKKLFVDVFRCSFNPIELKKINMNESIHKGQAEQIRLKTRMTT